MECLLATATTGRWGLNVDTTATATSTTAAQATADEPDKQEQDDNYYNDCDQIIVTTIFGTVVVLDDYFISGCFFANFTDYFCHKTS
jgi:hypothetical protein